MGKGKWKNNQIEFSQYYSIDLLILPHNLDSYFESRWSSSNKDF